jgi:hypothetical protein
MLALFMEPRRQDCFGLCGYGSGYYIRETFAAARQPARPGRHRALGFCDRCPAHDRCWAELKRRAEAGDPIAVAAWTAAKDQADAAGYDSSRLAAKLARAGRPDPFMGRYLANLQRGLDDRG